ncbi:MULTISPECIES: DUF3152 domain-containing protein [unclassified Streptomyces]|uniref:DUF3152 domain-containing protein n=1 Tax=unclassified Streptomyces TaxID=2593676 RepID=UPI00380C6A00
MGRHSRRGPASKDAPRGGTGKQGSTGQAGQADGAGSARDGGRTGGTGEARVRPRDAERPAETFRPPTPPDGTPARGVPRPPDGTPAHGMPRLPDPTPAHGLPVQGVRRVPDGTPPYGFPQVRGGHPEQGESGRGYGPNGTQGAYGAQSARGMQGAYGAADGRAGDGAARGGAERSAAGRLIPRQRPESAAGRRADVAAGPRQDYLDAFAEAESHTGAEERAGGSGRRGAFARRTPVAAAAVARTADSPDARATPRPTDAYASVTDWDHGPRPAPAGGASGASGAVGGSGGSGGEPSGDDARSRGGKGRAFTGVAAAAVTTVLAIVVAGQVTDARDDDAVRSQSTADNAARDLRDTAGRDATRPSPSLPPSPPPLTYEQKMDLRYGLGATLEGPGKFDAVPGVVKAPGTGEKFRYRVDVEQGLGLDANLFAEAVQKTLNDNRSWAHKGGRTFERIHSGEPDFVITLASPGTTAEWCAKSGLDTTEDNVSCDSASTERVMINAYRWAQGSPTYGDAMYAYRQMLINHEVGHRLGYGHVTCDKSGDLAPVMQQQTKFLTYDGITCRPNQWPYPKG